MNILRKIRSTFFQKSDYRRFLLRKLPEKSIGCELGVWKGYFSREILSIVNPKKLYLICRFLIIRGGDPSRRLEPRTN